METSLSSILNGLSALFYTKNSSLDNLPKPKPSYDLNRNSLLSTFDPVVTSILSAMEKVSENGCFYKGNICYKHLGCFNTQESASKLTCFLPEFPSLLRNQFNLYTRLNTKPISLSYEADDALAFQAVPENANLVILIHGYCETGSDRDYIKMKDRLLQYTAVDAVIVVDHKIAVRFGNFLRAIVNTELVGRQVAVIIERLRVHRLLNTKNVHLVGFSLGAKVSHFASFWGRKMFNHRLGRITGRQKFHFY